MKEPELKELIEKARSILHEAVNVAMDILLSALDQLNKERKEG